MERERERERRITIEVAQRRRERDLRYYREGMEARATRARVMMAPCSPTADGPRATQGPTLSAWEDARLSIS